MLWIAALVALYPFFAALESITAAGEESLLPRDSESSRASSYVSRISGAGGSDILYVSGIDVRDPSTALKVSGIIYGEANSSAVVNIGGFPRAVLEVYRGSENASKSILRAASSGAREVLGLVGYIEGNLSTAVGGFTNLSIALREVRDAIQSIDLNYSAAVDLSYSISRNLSYYGEGLRLLDKIYSEAYWQAYNYSKRISALISGLIENSGARYNISTLYVFTWWQAARTVYYYNISREGYTAYTDLSSIDPNMRPLPPDVASTIYARVSQAISSGSPPDLAITAAASEILFPQALRTYVKNISEDEQRFIVELVSRAWLDTYREAGSCLYCMLAPPDQEGSHIRSQISLLTYMMTLRDRLSSRIGDEGRRYVEDMVYTVIVGQGVGGDIARGLARLIVWGNVTPEAVAELVVGGASGYMGNLSRYSQNVSEILVRLDPEAKGVIWGNSSASREALTLLVARIGRVGVDLASSIVDLGLRNASRADFAQLLRPYISKLAENMSRGLLTSSNITYILSKYDPEARGALARTDLAVNASLELLLISPISSEYRDILRAIPGPTLYSLAAGGDPVALAKGFFLSQARDRVLSYASAMNLSQRALEGLWALVNYVVTSYPGYSEAEVYRYVESILSISIGDQASSMGYSIDSQVSEMIASLSLSIAVGRISIEDAASNVSPRIFSTAYRSALDALVGRVVGEGGRSFIVTYTPPGPDQYASSTSFSKRVSEAIKREYPGASIMWTGSIAIGEELKRSSSEDVARISRVSEALVFAVLLAILGSLAAVILPYAGIVLGVVVGGGIAYFIASSGYVDMLSLTRILIYVIPLGLGSDYAAYLVYRYKEEYSRTRDPKAASEAALRRAGPAIVASALTVIAGFGSLALGWEFPLFRSLGVYMPLVVAVTASSCLTLVPAILSIAGGSKKFWWGFGGIPVSVGRSRVAEKAMRLGYAAPIIFAIISIASIAVYPTITSSHDLRLLLPSNSQPIAALDVIASDIGYGQVFPNYLVVVKNSSISAGDLAKIEELASRIAGMEGVQSVEGPTRPFGAPINISSISLEDPAVSMYISGNASYMRILLKQNPFSESSVRLIENIREASREWASANGYTVYVGGATATSEELDRLVNSLFWYRVLPFAVVSMILIFALAFRSIPASIIAVSIVILSSLISIVLTGLIFSRLLGTPMIWFLPQVVFTAMLGVGMDYNSFYMARAREICASEGMCGLEGVSKASAAVGRLIMGLAMVMAAAFGSLMLSSSPGLRQIGLSLLISVMLIASASSYLVAPPIISMLGRRAWRIAK